MNNKTISIFIVISGILISGAIFGFANAQTATLATPSDGQQSFANIKYPIKELGNCKNKQDCKIFCDNSKNSDVCLTFAEQNNLMSSEELTVAKKFTGNGMIGPGGCKGQVACDQYCGNSVHLEECINFAQKNGMMSDQQLKDSQKVLTAIKNGLKPPACSGPKQCDAYCSSSEHMAECMTFSLAAGMVPDDQKEQMQKMLDAIKQGAKPPACHGQQECDAYCSSSEHMAECMTFSLAAGMVPNDQKEQVQKILTAIKQGIKPPACQPNQPNQPNQHGKNPPINQQGQPRQFNQFNQPNQLNQSSQVGNGLPSCDQYCADPDHIQECVKFSVAVGNMTEQQAQVSIKTGGKGPGGCIGKDACDAFCGNPENQETCFNFGKDNGMISQKDLQKMEEGKQRMKDSFSQMPQEVLNCLTSSLGADIIEKMKNGTMIPQKAGDSINQCFQKYDPQGKNPNNRNPQNQGQFEQGGPNNNMSGDLKDCIQNQVGEDGLTKIQSGNANDPILMEKAKICFDKYGQQNQPSQQMQPSQMMPYNKSGSNQVMNQNQQQYYGQSGSNQPMQPNQFIQGQPGQMQYYSQSGSNQIINKNQQDQPGQLPSRMQYYGQSGSNQAMNQNQQQYYGQSGSNQVMNQNQQQYYGQSGSNQPMQPNQFIQGQPGQMQYYSQSGSNQIMQLDQPDQFNQIQPGQAQYYDQPGSIQIINQNPSPPISPASPAPSSFLRGAQKFFGSVLNAFFKK